jgi:hypothetical protein
MNFLRRKYNIKPELWGPFNQVQWAVRDYFNNILGVPTPAVYVPFIEQGSQVVYNYGSAKGYDGTLIGAVSWNGGSVFIPEGIADYILFTTCNGLSALNDQYSLIFRLKDYSHTGANSSVAYLWDNILQCGSYGDTLSCYKSSATTINPLQYSIVGTATNTVATTYSTANLKPFRNISNSTRLNSGKLYIDGVLKATDSTADLYANSNYGQLSATPNIGYTANAEFSIDTCIVWGQYEVPIGVHLHLTQEPYAPIQPKTFPSYFFFGAAAPASGRLKNPFHRPFAGPFGGPF